MNRARPERGAGALGWLCGLALLCLHAGAMAAPRVFAVAHSVYASPALVAQANGYFADEGLDISVTRCAAGQVCLKTLLEGQADFATVADAPIAVASFRHPEFGILGSIAQSGRELRILVRRDRGIQTLADLRGRRVGVIIGTSGHYYLETAIRFGGLQMSDVTLVPLDPSDAAAAIVAGQVDAAALFEPFLGQAGRRLGADGLALPPLSFFRMSFNVVAAQAPRVDDDTARRLLRALRRASEFIASSPQRAQAIVATAVGIPEADVAAIWPYFRFGLTLDQGLINSLEGHARWAMRTGQTDQRTMPDYTDRVRTAPLSGLDAGAVRILK